MTKICGRLVNDGTGVMAWGYVLYLDDEYVGGRKYFSTKFMAKLYLNHAVRSWPPKTYKVCRAITAPKEVTIKEEEDA